MNDLTQAELLYLMTNRQFEKLGRLGKAIEENANSNMSLSDVAIYARDALATAEDLKANLDAFFAQYRNYVNTPIKARQ